ncbi:MAG TPA: SOS response-associated peptidase family protein, partial [Bacteroidia bacterium]|nr:SOS response-associated peptidase family protein [Bacteroidia bacterium]
EEICSLGGVYDEWVNEATGEINTTFSIITTEANPLMEKIHNIKKRMPLIFTRHEEEHWIESSLQKNNIDAMMKPLDESLMVAHTIKKINTKTIDVFSDEILKEVEYPELALLD